MSNTYDRERMRDIQGAAQLASTMAHLLAGHLRGNEWHWSAQALCQLLNRLDSELAGVVGA